MAADKQIEILDLPEDARALVRECELTGGRSIFTRDKRPVAILISIDEYVSLRETVDITGDAPLRERLATAEDEVRRGAMLLVDDLLETGGH